MPVICFAKKMGLNNQKTAQDLSVHCELKTHSSLEVQHSASTQLSALLPPGEKKQTGFVFTSLIVAGTDLQIGVVCGFFSFFFSFFLHCKIIRLVPQLVLLLASGRVCACC